MPSGGRRRENTSDWCYNRNIAIALHESFELAGHYEWRILIQVTIAEVQNGLAEVPNLTYFQGLLISFPEVGESALFQ